AARPEEPDVNVVRSIRLLIAGAVVAIAPATAAFAVDVHRVANRLGIESWLVEDHSKAYVAVAFAFPRGSSPAPPSQRRLTHSPPAHLYEGAGSLDIAAYKARLKAQPIQLGFDFDRDSLYGEMLAPTASRDEAGRLLGAALSAPRFDPEAVERVRNLIL